MKEVPAKLVLDVRTEGEAQSGHVEGSLNIPLAQLAPTCIIIAHLDIKSSERKSYLRSLQSWLSRKNWSQHTRSTWN
jgi:rhodanese-related sulfurtransferase